MKEKIILLAVSPNKEGNSFTLAKNFLSQINSDKYEVEIIYLYNWHLNYCSNENFNFGPEEKDVEKEAKELFSKFKNTKYVVLATPIWNFGLPAILKNFLDRASNYGRVWSDKKNMKVPNWKEKKFFLIFTSGAPKVGLVLNFVAILQTFLSLKYYGAKKKIVKIKGSCGNGKRNLLKDKTRLLNKMSKKGKKIFI
ncbi:MAG TPA: NAD(P)H-dependent oxidoreductase [Patescibacteria group bacterium]|nr:NAD(P)H-dependent oxidoreductase [Patescibacteria group bacterium]